MLYDTGALGRNEALIGQLLEETNQALGRLPFDAATTEALGSLANYVAVRDR